MNLHVTCWLQGYCFIRVRACDIFTKGLIHGYAIFLLSVTISL